MQSRPKLITLLLVGISLFIATPGFSESGLEDASPEIVVTVVEYRSEIAPLPGTSSSEIVAQLLKADAKPVKTIRLSTLSNTVASFQATERIGIPDDSDGGDKLRFIEVGTILGLTAQRLSSSVLIEIDYSSSRLTNENVSGATPRVKTMTVQNTYTFEPGVPVLIGGLTANDGFYLVATVTIPQAHSNTNE